MKTFEVVAEIIKNKEKILCTQRGLSKFDYISKKWEFPMSPFF
jgi:8-oxo-dGTP diphosphatase